MTEPSVQEYHDKADVSARRIAKVYAAALLDTAQKQGQAETVLAELDSLRARCLRRASRNWKSSYRAPPSAAMPAAPHCKGYSAAGPAPFSSTSCRSSMTTSVSFCSGRSWRLATAMYDERHRRLRVLVSSAVPLPDDIRQRIENGVRNFFHLEPVLIPLLDPGLLGGLKVRIGDGLYDASVRTQTRQSSQSTDLARSSHEIQSGRDRFSSAE